MAGELRTIRQQMQADFKTIMTAFGVQCDAVSTGFREIHKRMADVEHALAAQEGILADFAARTGARFDEIVTVVEGMEAWRAAVDERLDALERKQAG